MALRMRCRANVAGIYCLAWVGSLAHVQLTSPSPLNVSRQANNYVESCVRFSTNWSTRFTWPSASAEANFRTLFGGRSYARGWRYAANFGPETPELFGDVTEFRAADLPACDLLTAGCAPAALGKIRSPEEQCSLEGGRHGPRWRVASPSLRTRCNERTPRGVKAACRNTLQV